ncbi:hypothetical protein BI308_23170 [Roseofilum reptotaenium AO1-A]|uniref:F5/8 type C domain-containing protein n=1 Tax=Roseofilum reptotaenium AO1-A TaxID=1925591 RepID=A0A1L9QKM0_9CYAN|nr:hypothetical protein BI308_23170 [Roseofilum reptotaenium AO1-A]
MGLDAKKTRGKKMIINTGTAGNINLVGDKLILTVSTSDGSEASLVVEGGQNSIGNEGSDNNGGAATEALSVESAGKGIKFTPPIPSEPVVLGIDKQDGFYSLWQGSPIQVFQWSQEPNSERSGATWMGEFNPSDKQFILLNPSPEKPWFSFLTKNVITGAWDTARIGLKEGRKLYFWDFEEPTEAWQYEENVTPSPTPTPTPTPGASPTPAPTPTPVRGWMPTSGWKIKAEAYHYQTAALVTTGSLSSINDGNEDTYWASPVLSQHNVALTIDLGQLVEIKKISISSGDIPHKAKGSIQTSDDGSEFTSIGFSGFLNGEIAINQTKRFIRIHCGQNINAAYDEWHLKELFLYGTYNSNLVGGSPSPTPTPVPVPTPPPSPTPTPIEPSAYLDSNIILKPDTLADGNLSDWDGYVQRGSTQPTVTSHGNYKLVSFSGYSELAKSLSSKANFYGVTCIIKSPNPSWNNWGNVWTHNVLNHSWTFALDKDGTTIGNNPPLSRVRVNKSEISYSSNWELGAITNLFCLTIFWDASMIIHSSGNLVIHRSNISDWQCEYSLGDVLVWGNMPSDAELVEVEDWMMGKYSI